MDENNFITSARELPHSIEAEQCVLGAILCNTDLLPSTMDYLKPESFYIENHKRLYSVMLRLFSSANAVIDAMTVLDAAVTDGLFEDSASGNQYLAQIMKQLSRERTADVMHKYSDRSGLTRNKSSRNLIHLIMKCLYGSFNLLLIFRKNISSV